MDLIIPSYSRSSRCNPKFMHVTLTEIIPRMLNVRLTCRPRPRLHRNERERRIIIPIRLAAMLLGMYYVEILGYRHFPDLLRVRGGWLTVYLQYILSVNSDAALRDRTSKRARAPSYFYVDTHFYGASNIFRVISKRQNGGACTEKFRAIFELRKLMPQVVNNPPV